MDDQNKIESIAGIYKSFKESTPEQRAEFIAELRKIGRENNRPGLLRMADAFEEILEDMEAEERAGQNKKPCQCANTDKAAPLNAYHDN